MNRLDFITDGEQRLLCGKNWVLNEISRFTLKESSSMGQAVNGPPVTTETRFPSQVIPCPSRYLHSGTVTRNSNVIPPIMHINLCLYVDLTRRAKEQSLLTQQKAALCRQSESFR